MPRPGRYSSQAEKLEEEAIEVKSWPPRDATAIDELSSSRISAIKDEAARSDPNSPSLSPTKIETSRTSSFSTTRSKAIPDAVMAKSEAQDLNGHAAAKVEAEPPVKPSRAVHQKGVPRIAPSLGHLPDATIEATSSFALMTACTYTNKFLGYTEHAMECDCSEEWDATARQNFACGDDSDCINRATKMECVGDCPCGSACQNQRFQQRQYADVSVIKTEKKGYGLRTNVDLRHGDFIFEYVGEVINEPQFRRRMRQYDEEGIKHFYFMSLSKGEFVDATRKGNLGRFCNHSCNPNCYVDKWVVGDKLRMGIFAEKKISAGEELVFNYNVDRYGANPQPCYCGESNCTGFIGGKTQTERATKLSAATIEALGIEDADSWDTAVAKRPKKKKTGEDDEEYVEGVEAKSLEADGVTKVMAALMQCKEKWIAVKLLQRIQKCEDEQVRNRVVKVHGYQILNSQLAAWKEDDNVVLQILDILDKFPRLTRNKIQDSKIEDTLRPLTESANGRVSTQATKLIEEWSKLEVAYRIPRKKRDPSELATPTKTEPARFDRRESNHERKRSRSRSRSPPRGPSTSSAPSGPRSSLPQRNNFYGPRPPFNRGPPPLPRGWSSALDNNGRTYYYSTTGHTTWSRPTQPVDQPPPPPKQPSDADVLKSIINDIVSTKEKEREVKNSTPNTPPEAKKDRKEKKEKREDKWKSYDEEKKKKLYENTLFPHISHVMNKYKSRIPREDLKRFAKDLAKKLVASDFKAGRVTDPTKIDEKHQHKVKKYCKDFFDKAAHKHKKHEQEKAARKNSKTNAAGKDDPSSVATPAQNLDASPDAPGSGIKKEDMTDDEDVKMSEDEDDDNDEEKPSPTSPLEDKDMANGDSLKRKRSISDADQVKQEGEDITQSPTKKLDIDSAASPPPPPPPPPPGPPTETPPDATPWESMDASPADMEIHTHLHADTSFKSKSMADVLAEAQQDDEDADTSMQDANTSFESGLRQEGGLIVEDEILGNSMVDGQVKVKEIQMEG